MSKQRRRKRKGSRYHTGIHKSDKCINSPIKYRSSWELTVARHFDTNPQVLSYAYEPFKIPYISNKQYGKIRHYIPDFLVRYIDGKTVLIEVKRQSALNQLKVRKKAKAARIWATEQVQPTFFEFWTDPIIKKLQEIEKIKEQYDQQ